MHLVSSVSQPMTRLPCARKNLHMRTRELTRCNTQAEVAIGEKHIVSLRFTTNRRVTKWLGGTTNALQFPQDTARVVTVVPIGREIVGLFSAATAKFHQIGFITRLRMGDYSWRPKAKTQEITGV